METTGLVFSTIVVIDTLSMNNYQNIQNHLEIETYKKPSHISPRRVDRILGTEIYEDYQDQSTDKFGR